MFDNIKKFILAWKKENSELHKLRRDNLELIQHHKTIMNAFKEGTDEAWTMIQVCLYDMYKNMEILDYASLIGILSERLREYELNDELKAKKFKQFNDDLSLRMEMVYGDDWEVEDDDN